MGTLTRATDGAIAFTYDPAWLLSEAAFPVACALPLTTLKWQGDPVIAAFDNLLPDAEGELREKIATRVGAQGKDVFSLLSVLGRDCEPLVHYTDTGGVSDHVFALFHLLGMTFAPRLRDFPDRRLACFGSAKAWANLSPIIGKPINEEVNRQHWGDIMRLAASIQDKSLKPSEILRKFGAYRQQNRLYLALGEIGRIERTLFMLDWIENADLRMECHAGLNGRSAPLAGQSRICAFTRAYPRSL